MKTRLFHIAGFSLLFASAYYGVYFFLFNVSVGNKLLIQKMQEEVVIEKDVFGRTLKEFDRTKKYDVVFLGSSHCYRCFDPMLFQNEGLDSYNLGSSSQTPLNSYSLLKTLAINTKTILLEVYPVVSGLSGEESFLSMNASIDDYNLLFQFAWDLNYLRCYNALSIKPFIDNYNKNTPLNILKSDRGYVETTDSIKKEEEYDSIILNTEYCEKQIEYIGKIISHCKEKNVAVFLAYAPIPSELKIKGENEFIEAVKILAEKEKVEFYNLGRNHPLNSKLHFFDNDHINKAGVEWFNHKLIELMRQKKN